MVQVRNTSVVGRCVSPAQNTIPKASSITTSRRSPSPAIPPASGPLAERKARTTTRSLPKSTPSLPDNTRLLQRGPSPSRVSTGIKTRTSTPPQCNECTKIKEELLKYTGYWMQEKEENLALKQQLGSWQERYTEAMRFISEKEEQLVAADLEKRKLLNELVDCKGQIRVAIRTRPFLPNEESCEHIGYPAPNKVVFDASGSKPVTYEFQKVFGPNFTQERLFEDVEELIQSVLHGYNVSIIAFGQTGSGKTYTMRGGNTAADDGIIPRAVRCLFQNRKKQEDLGWTFEFSASYVEVYNDEIYDLLGNRNKLVMKKVGCLDLADGLVRLNISDPSKIDVVLKTADKSRTVAATKCNESSSRSHALFELRILAKNAKLGSELGSLLHLVDLAGSERINESGVEGDRLRETTHINKSLTNLKLCIRSQRDNKQHVPYRNCKLTSLLSCSLGGGTSKTYVIVTLNPSASQAAETKRSLDFAKDMSVTKIGAAVRMEK